MRALDFLAGTTVGAVLVLMLALYLDGRERR